MNEYWLKRFDGSIYLCGFMATGKSTVGRRVAELLEMPFVDLDDVITEKEGKTIKEIFEQEGEEYFRKVEWTCLLELTRTYKGIVALGGGALHNQRVVDHLKVHGLLVYLKTPLDVIVERVMRNTKRPIVLDDNGKLKTRDTLFSELKTLYSSREPLYEQAQITLEGNGKSIKKDQAQALVEKIKRYV